MDFGQIQIEFFYFSRETCMTSYLNMILASTKYRYLCIW